MVSSLFSEWETATTDISNDITLYRGNSMSLLPTIPADSVDAVITDPPYGMRFRSNSRKRTEKFDMLEGDGAPFVWWCYDAARVLKDDGIIICFTRWDVADAFHKALNMSGMRVAAELIWHKGGGGMGNLKQTPAPEHEKMWLAIKAEYALPGGRPMSVYRENKIPPMKVVHPTEKPVSLIQRLIQDYTQPGALVLDPFFGAGSTPVACVVTGRRFIGAELDKRYFDIAQGRVMQAMEGV